MCLLTYPIRPSVVSCSIHVPHSLHLNLSSCPSKSSVHRSFFKLLNWKDCTEALSLTLLLRALSQRSSYQWQSMNLSNELLDSRLSSVPLVDRITGEFTMCYDLQHSYFDFILHRSETSLILAVRVLVISTPFYFPNVLSIQASRKCYLTDDLMIYWIVVKEFNIFAHIKKNEY